MMPSTMQGKKTKGSKLKRIGSAALVAAFWIAVWEALYYLVNQDILIASPQAVIARGAQLVVTPDFWMTAGLSLCRILIGYLIAVAAGVLVAVATSASKVVYALLYPIISILRVTPVASFIILALVWISAGAVPSLMAGIIVLPIVWANVSEGIAGTDPQLLEMARMYRFGRLKTFRRIYVPSVAPYFTATCMTGLGMAWKAGIAAEVLSVPKLAIGTNIYDAKRYIETADLFFWTLVVIILSMILEKVVRLIVKQIMRRVVGGSVPDGTEARV